MKKCYTFLPKSWLRFGLTTAFTASISFKVQAQSAPAILWDKTFGGNGQDELNFLKQTSDGGFILGGSSNSGSSFDKTETLRGQEDFWVVKLDAYGSKIWDRTFGGNNSDVLNSLQQTSDGGYILGGYSWSNIGGEKTQNAKGANDYWVIKLNANGNKVWDKTIGGNRQDVLTSLMQTSDGGYILGGSTISYISGDKTDALKGVFNDYWIVKLDANGNILWDKGFGGSLGNVLNSLQQISDGGYILGGYSWSGISGDKSQACQGGWDYWVVKLDASGNKLWDKTFGGSQRDKLSCVRQTSDGGYILGGSSLSGISGDKTQALQGSNDFWVVKLDTNGTKIWDRTFGGNDDDDLLSLKQTTDGGFILGGTSSSGISGDKTQVSRGGSDFWVLKINASGNKMWDLSFGGNNNETLRSLQQTSDNGFVLGGFSASGVSGDKSEFSKGMTDYWIVKLAADITGIKEPKANFAVSISPNPNQGKFTLHLSNLTAPKAEVTISDLLGRVVLQEQSNISNNQLSEELTLPNAKGLYLLQVKAGEQIITRKIVVE